LSDQSAVQLADCEQYVFVLLPQDGHLTKYFVSQEIRQAASQPLRNSLDSHAFEIELISPRW
jgi:hypothetical protein